MTAPTPRLVATDLDGTLVRSDGSVSPYTADVLAKVEALGVPVVFVTGRPLRWTEEVFEHVGSHGLAVVSNGALVWDVARHRPALERPIEPALGLEMCTLLRKALPGTVFAVETLDGIGLEPEFLERHRVPEGARRAPVEELFDEPALKLLARHEDLAPQEFWDAAEQVVLGRLVITWSSSTSLLEISAPGVTKASTLALLCADLGIEAADVIAFGDMPNDLPMLSWAGTSYAMADAHPTVTAAASHVAPGHDDDGVAQVLAGVFGL
ncbi:Cof-type HAD-IIB family hydrolase [Nocardioides sp. SR21]|uniref:Cof-type HAD-IIB family hydrolase n=1 Tax=Nocardioides sp. SR21 TaxID=2919501 RepID=UPI001FA99DA5|nr:Cof-type HAD-IIB family hydrolase [Nocardioides sp. SR21]